MTTYEPTPHPTIRQGDIYLAPIAKVLNVTDALGIEDEPVAPPHLGVVVNIHGWPQRDAPWCPGIAFQATHCPVMIISHDCELEKDFNERVSMLIREGATEDEAIGLAEGDPSLDPFAVVAPLLPYSAFPEFQHGGIRDGQRIGILPVDALPGDGGDYVADLSEPATLSVTLLSRHTKLASLTEPEVARLRYKISETYSTRDLSVLKELQAIIGKTILRAEAEPKSAKKTSLVLYLEGGEVITMEIKRPREELGKEITRTSR